MNSLIIHMLVGKILIPNLDRKATNLVWVRSMTSFICVLENIPIFNALAEILAQVKELGVALHSFSPRLYLRKGKRPGSSSEIRRKGKMVGKTKCSAENNAFSTQQIRHSRQGENMVDVAFEFAHGSFRVSGEAKA